MKKLLSIIALISFMVSSASVVDFNEKGKKKAKTEKKACSTKSKKSCCSKK